MTAVTLALLEDLLCSNRRGQVIEKMACGEVDGFRDHGSQPCSHRPR